MTSPLTTRLCLIVGEFCGIFCGGQGSPFHSQSSSLGGDAIPLRGALRFDSVQDYSILFFSSLTTTAFTGPLRRATIFRHPGPLRSAVLVPVFTATYSHRSGRYKTVFHRLDRHNASGVEQLAGQRPCPSGRDWTIGADHERLNTLLVLVPVLVGTIPKPRSVSRSVSEHLKAASQEHFKTGHLR